MLDAIWEKLAVMPWEFWQVLARMSPYLLFGFAVAGVLSVFLSPAQVEKHLGGRGIGPVFKAAAFGVPLPLCSCGVIPVSASLRRHNASRGATTAFLISTPQTGVDSIFVTYSLLGGVFAVLRPLLALVAGLVGGLLADVLTGGDDLAEVPEKCQDACCDVDKPKSNRFVQAARYGFVTLAGDISRALLVGLLIAAVISAVVPHNYFADALGRTGNLWHDLGVLFLMMLLGIPVYVCATASVPMAGAMIAAGVSPGAALVFLMTGPATNAATIATIWRIMGRRTATIYLLTVAATALAGGFLLDLLFPQVQEQVTSIMAGHEGVPWWQHASAVGMVCVLGYGVWHARKKMPSQQAPMEHAQIVELKITGMTCSHCAASVRQALLECDGVVAAEVDHHQGVAHVMGDALEPQKLAGVVTGLGYQASAGAVREVKT